MVVLTIGILSGLGAAAALSVSYVLMRLFIVGRRRGALRLLALGHIVMGIASAVALPFVWSGQALADGAFVRPMIAASGFYLTGQALQLLLLRKTDPSQISPLMTTKVIVLALIAVALGNETLQWAQWLGVLLAGVAAFALNYSGGTLPWRSLLLVGVAIVFFSLSDLHVKALVNLLGPPGDLRAAVQSVCLCYMLCGAVSLMLLPWIGRGATRDLGYALPFAVTWMAGAVLMFTCFGTIGAVFGNVLQSARGLFSIMLGALLAALGMVHVETKRSLAVVLQRIGAGLLMILAIALYAWGG